MPRGGSDLDYRDRSVRVIVNRWLMRMLCVDWRAKSACRLELKKTCVSFAPFGSDVACSSVSCCLIDVVLGVFGVIVC